MKIQTTRIYTELAEALANGYTTVSAQGSSRSSKTYNICIFLIVHLLTHPKKSLSVVRATLPALKGSVFRDIQEIIGKMGVSVRLNKSDFTITFDNGSFIEFFSTDSEQKLRGRKRNILYVNEANELRFIEWQQLKMRTTDFSVMDYNPSFTEGHWICGVNEEKGTYHFVTTYKDNPFLEQTIVDEIESLQWKNPSLWQVYGLGKMAVVEGLVFPKIEEHAQPFPMYILNGERYLAVDFGYESDPTAIVDVAFHDGGIYIDQVCYRTKMRTDEIIRELKSYCESCHRLFEVVSESADPRLVDEIYAAGVDIKPVRKYAGSVMAGIMKMQEFTLHVTKRSVDVVREFKNYTYRQDKEGNWMNEPVDAFNHAIDAIRYVVLEKKMGGRREGLSAAQILNML